MIPANELIHGCLYYNMHGEVIEFDISDTTANSDDGKIDAVFKKDDNGKIVSYQFFDPIPISVEWLNKFGFEKDQDESDGIQFATKDGPWVKYCVNNNQVLMDFENTASVRNLVDICGIEYVHQLQNLYHALTGEELKINLSNK